MVEEIKDRLKSAMEASGVSEHDLAKHLKISYQAIKKILAGKTGHFSVPNHFAAAHFLGVDPEWLASGEDGGEKKPLSQTPVASYYRSPFSETLTNEMNAQPQPVTAWIESVVGLLLAAPHARAQKVTQLPRRLER